MPGNYFLSMMEVKRLGCVEEGVDVVFSAKAKKEGKKTGALETVEQQLNFILGLGKGKEAELVVSGLEDLAELPKLLEEMIGAWRTGNLEKMEKLINKEMKEQHPEIFEELIVKRNKAWVPIIEEWAKSREVAFVLVGAGHLCGEEGLLGLLEKRGFRVERVEVSKE